MRALLTICASLALLWAAAPAQAAVLPPQVFAVPGGNVFEAGNVAVSEDGSAGAVFVATTGGTRHIYATILRGGVWSEPQRVDVDQAFDSFVPRIGVGDGGRAVVVWVQRGPASSDGLKHDQLYSATLDPGASIFEAPVLVDYDVGPADFVYPDISMNAVGAAYMVYRNVVATPSAGTPPAGVSIPEGDAFAYTKVARYNGWAWSRFDQPINRNTVGSVRFPNDDNGPKIATTASGAATVAFQEPDASTFARVWIRKLFGMTAGLPMIASPTEWGGAQLRGDADAIALSVSRSGAVGVAFRQSPGAGSALDRPRIMTNRINDPGDQLVSATTFNGVKLADTLATASTPGRPYLRLKKDAEYDLGFSVDGGAYTQRSTAQVESPLVPAGAAGTGPAQDVYSSVADDDSLVQAVVVGASVRIAESSAGTAVFVSAPSGGDVDALRFAANNSGDAAIAALQQTDSGRRFIVDSVDSAPDPFQVNAPEGWVRTPKPGLSWIRLPDGSGPLRYEMRVDGKLVAATFNDSASLGSIKDGRHRVSLAAVDAIGQRLQIPAFSYPVDRHAPKLTVRRLRGGGVRAKLYDGPVKKASGVSSSSRISWGGSRAARFKQGVAIFRGRVKGSLRVVVKARDRAGNRVTIARRIRG